MTDVGSRLDTRTCRARPLLRAGALMALSACAFDPVARPVQEERLMESPARVLRTLDTYGVHALIRYEDAEGKSTLAISNWRADRRCELPTDVRNLWNPLASNDSATDPTRRLLVPFARGPSATETTLWLVDEDCTFTGPIMPVDAGTVSIISSVVDQRDLFVFRDFERGLYALDATRSFDVTHLADGVTATVAGVTGVGGTEDALWSLEGPNLTQRALDGTLLVQLGDEVKQFALYGGITPRVAYVDGGDLYEAAAPSFQPVLRAEDACDPSYPGSSLDLHVPCASRQLVRVDLATGEAKEFEPGVFASLTIDGLQFDYASVANDAGGTDTALYLEQPARGATPKDRRLITPLLRSESLVVLSNDKQSGRVAGQTFDDTFGIWSLGQSNFTPLFRRVAALVPLLDTRAGEYIWLMHHDVVDEIGTLSSFTQTDLTLRTIAKGVPTYGRRGFVIDGGRAIPKFPYPESILVYLEEATPLSTSTPDNPRFRGRLRAQLLSGALGADIADNVSSFVIVASPLPGVLYGVEEGPNVGLWFAAL